LNKRGSALLTVLIIVILVPIIVFGATTFISNSLVRYTTQNRNMQALYLAQGGIHRAIYYIQTTATPVWPLSVPVGGNTIAVSRVASCSNIYQLVSTGTSVATTYPTAISRSVFAEYDSTANKISKYLEGTGAGIPVPVCCDDLYWSFDNVNANKTETTPVQAVYQGTLTAVSHNVPARVNDRFGSAQKALDFNSGNNVNFVGVFDSSGLGLTTAGTLMAWVDIGTTVASAAVIHKGGTTTGTMDYALILDKNGNNNSRIQLTINGVTSYQSNINVSKTGWHHIAATWGPGGMCTYLDGGNQSCNATQPTARTNNQSLYIGKAGISGAGFIGAIDEVHIFSCQKTLSEINSIYVSTEP